MTNDKWQMDWIASCARNDGDGDEGLGARD